MSPAKATLLDKFMNEGEPWNFNNNEMHICSLCATCSTLLLFSMSVIGWQYFHLANELFIYPSWFLLSSCYCWSQGVNLICSPMICMFLLADVAHTNVVHLIRYHD